MNRKLTFCLSVLLIGVLLTIFQQQDLTVQRRLWVLRDTEVEDEITWDEVLFRGDDSEPFVHPPCQKTKVEQQHWLFTVEAKHAYEEINQPNVDMVISVCEEDINRVMFFATRLKVKSVYIYSKCEQAIELDDTVVKQFETVDITVLPNVGREGHSWLTHMLRDDLKPDRWSIFFQGQIEVNLFQARLAIISAHEHDQQNDGTTFIHMHRVQQGEFCHPMDVSHYELYRFMRLYNLPRYQSHQGRNNYLDFMGKQLVMRGEFVAKNSLFSKLDKEKILDIKARLEVENCPREGYYLEALWVNVLGASDNCRCEGMPTNNLPVGRIISFKKPTQQSKTIKEFEAKYAVDGKNETGVLRFGAPYASTGPPEGQDKSWWLVDLETIAIIRTIKITLPQCCKGSLENAVLEILDTDQKVVSSQPIVQDEKEELANKRGFVFYLHVGWVKGRFVRITRSGGANLNLSQVEVTGFPISAKTLVPAILG
mmetsp:Transcript_27427/g.41527  ORF Transcript_27427/g.41527 Transcript_27427/m.41527 type:complete len:482 (-) Transcript_27427:85-1530(-)|eukprot:CAMPEP_0178914128 /NCGR_PEP_ID=MMETSP0786-20121207/11243_1 /TAXON_ID=186022 /ORGANISM="Thalassionema frauenfeldii, Strain CCMP 1798" /LENGTH=481 /DNA_ID=CAMNT_0020586981 /DNA_START=48 /DNA_END=1493 /DNA_ORIENTATION=+